MDVDIISILRCHEGFQPNSPVVHQTLPETNQEQAQTSEDIGDIHQLFQASQRGSDVGKASSWGQGLRFEIANGFQTSLIRCL